MLRILISDDHAVVRQGLKKILTDEFRQATFGEAENGQQVLDLCAEQHWDVVVLDLSMPIKCGLDVLKELKHRRPRPPVLVLSIHPETQYAVRALRSGAAGYLTKQSAPEELAKAVKKVLAGGKYITPGVAETLALELDLDSERPLHEALSDREFQVLCRIASGKALKEVARDMALSPKTISTYRARILEKMKMKTNAELTLYAVQQGLVR